MAASRKKPATKIAGATGGEMNRNGTSGYQPRSCRVEETWLSRNPLPSTPVQNQDHVFGGAVKYVSVLLTPYACSDRAAPLRRFADGLSFAFFR